MTVEVALIVLVTVLVVWQAGRHRTPPQSNAVVLVAQNNHGSEWFHEKRSVADCA